MAGTVQSSTSQTTRRNTQFNRRPALRKSLYRTTSEQPESLEIGQQQTPFQFNARGDNGHKSNVYFCHRRRSDRGGPLRGAILPRRHARVQAGHREARTHRRPVHASSYRPEQDGCSDESRRRAEPLGRLQAGDDQDGEHSGAGDCHALSPADADTSDCRIS